MRNIIVLLKPYRHLIFMSILLLCVESAALLAQPNFAQQIVQYTALTPAWNLVFQTTRSMLLVSLLGNLSGISNAFLAAKIAEHVSEDMANHTRNGNVDHPISDSEIIKIRNFILFTLRIYLRALIMLPGVLVMVSFTSPRMTLFFGYSILLMSCVWLWVLGQSSIYSFKLFEKLSFFILTLNLKVRSLPVLSKFARLRGNQSGNLAVNQIRNTLLIKPVLMVIMTFIKVCGLWVGGMEIANLTPQAGQWISVCGYASQVFSAFGLGLVFISHLSYCIMQPRIFADIETVKRISLVG
jgi:ABC-type multidrug transport system fused ATPase/permease subunit